MEVACRERPNQNPCQMPCGLGTAFFPVVELRDPLEPTTCESPSRQGQQHPCPRREILMREFVSAAISNHPALEAASLGRAGKARFVVHGKANWCDDIEATTRSVS